MSLREEVARIISGVGPGLQYEYVWADDVVRDYWLERADAAIEHIRSHFGMIEGLAREQTVEALEKSADTAAFVQPKQVASRMAALMRK